MQHIAIFASGEGTNAEHIMRFFDHAEARVVLVVYNRETAAVRERARRCGVPAVYVPREAIADEHRLMPLLRTYQVDFIVLAGFLQLLPSFVIKAFPDRIVNIHPSLMPKYCGKGMYGMKVHEAVVANGESETGITIHLVNERYDEGRVLCQVRCDVLPTDTAADVAARVHRLEYDHYPPVIMQQLQVTAGSH